MACEITTCDEVVATELVFENVLTEMEPAAIVALLSALIFQACFVAMNAWRRGTMEQLEYQ